MKESLAKALSGYSSLKQDDSHEMPVDKVGAIAYSQLPGAHQNARSVTREVAMARLGKRLFLLRNAHRQDEFPAALDELTDILQHRMRGLCRSDAHKVARLSIFEWIIDMCPTCQGATMIRDHDKEELEGVQPMKSCPTCAGVGVRRYSDHERAEALELEIREARRMFAAIDLALRVIRDSVEVSISTTAKMLERW